MSGPGGEAKSMKQSFVSFDKTKVLWREAIRKICIQDLEKGMERGSGNDRRRNSLRAKERVMRWIIPHRWHARGPHKESKNRADPNSSPSEQGYRTVRVLPHSRLTRRSSSPFPHRLRKPPFSTLFLTSLRIKSNVNIWPEILVQNIDEF